MTDSNNPSQQEEMSPKIGNVLRLPNGADTPPAASDDGFDLTKYAYKPIGGAAIKREQLTIPEGRPKDTYFRIDPRPHMQLAVSILEYKPEGRLSPDIYILTPDVAELLGRRPKHAVIRVCVCRPNILRLWAVKVPQTDRGMPNSFTQSTWEAVETLEKQWGRLDMNESGTGYDVILPENQWAEPEWRDDSLGSLIQKAFKGRFVDDMEHDIIKTLRGLD
jgi:hypothetical protein